MFGLGHAPELILVLAIGLIILGPGKIPEIAQFLGKALRELRQASADLQQTFNVNELMNPTPAPTPPPTPAPVEVAPAPLAQSETILPPAETPVEEPAKPKRTRKRAAPAENATAPVEVVASENGSEPAKPRPRRRPSKKEAEPVSLDVPV